MSADKPESPEADESGAITPESPAPEAEGEQTAETAHGEEAAERAPEDPISQLEEQLAAAQDAALRAQADAMNTQRRAEQEIEKARKFALERVCGDLLAVVDNLERALESVADDAANSALVEGVELTLKGFLDVLGKHGVKPIEPLGEPFDPETAQAMSMVEQPDAEPNSVIAVMQKGYSLNGRLLRPAMVMVAKAPA